MKWRLRRLGNRYFGTHQQVGHSIENPNLVSGHREADRLLRGRDRRAMLWSTDVEQNLKYRIHIVL